MSAFSVYTSNKVLDLLCNQTAFTAPAAIYAALFTAATGLDDNSPTAEVSGSNYSRVAVTNDFGVATAGAVTNSDGAILFPTASASWGTISHFAIMDAATSGNVLIWGALTNPQLVETGNAVQFLTSNLTISLT